MLSGRVLAAGLLFLTLRAQDSSPDEESIRRAISRLSEEAEVFSQLAPKVIGQEKLEQRAAKAPPRFRPRVGNSAMEQPKPRFQTREVISEYGFSTLKEAPNAIRELRQVVTVDGRTVRAADKARETLTSGLRSEDDRRKKRMLVEFESYGLVGAATDFGQLILLFGKRTVQQYKFGFKKYGQVGPDRVLVLTYEQQGGDDKLLIIEGKEAIHQRLRGEVWLRASDGLPLRITLLSVRAEKNIQVRDEATVEYQPSAYGLVLPASVAYDKYVGTEHVSENRFHYSEFKMFAASSEVKFTVDEDPKPPEPPKPPLN
jgi:hypothetical protein